MLRKRRVASALGAVVLAVLTYLGSGVGASVAQGGVRVGRAPVVPSSARPTGALSPSSTLDVDVVLAPSDSQALSSYAEAVSTPGSADYRRYLSSSQFAARFGASSSTVASVKTTLRREGLQIEGEASDGLVLHVRAPASSFERAWHVSIEKYRLASGASGFVSSSAPELPRSAASDISEILGLDSLVDAEPQTLRASTLAASSDSEHADALHAERAHLVAHAGGPQQTGSCSSAISSADSSDNPISWTYPDLAAAYEYDDLYNQGDLGQGKTVALIEFAPFVSSDITTFEDCFSTPPDPSITTVAVDGGSGSTSSPGGPGIDEGGEEEVELDIETIVGLAPDASIDVYEGPAAVSDTYILDTYTAAIDNPSVNVISTSWGDCEAVDDSSLVDAEATLFRQAAIEGKTVVAASGDAGSEDCSTALRGPAGSALAVDDPASQPYVTGVGGTDLTALGPSPTETTWNGNDGDGLPGGASGGGVSSLWDMPSYQADASASLGVLTVDSRCSSGSGDCREVPDVSADAGAPVAVYCTESGREGCASAGWTGFAGTSLAAPTWAALFALADASSACDGSALGFVNPALYAVAGGSDYASAFNDVTTGNNDLLGVYDGTYAAARGYDLATGLGTPIAGDGSGSDNGLVTQLCRAARPSSFPASTLVTTTSTSTTTTSTSSTATEATSPTVSKLSPTAGPKRGGTKVTISGSGFTAVSAVHFGAKKAISFRVQSATRIIAFAPADASTVYVTVTAGSHASRRVAAAKFSYLPIPIILSLTPRTASSAGGTKVTISGSGFTAVSAVHFGAKKAISFKVDSSTKIIAVSPMASGSLSVTVKTPGGTSRPRMAARLRFT